MLVMVTAGSGTFLELTAGDGPGGGDAVHHVHALGDFPNTQYPKPFASRPGDRGRRCLSD